MRYKFQIFKDAAGEFRWRFVAPNGQTVAVSGEGYKSRQSCLDGIDLVKTHAPGAPVEG
jgi:hypothetical protein